VLTELRDRIEEAVEVCEGGEGGWRKCRKKCEGVVKVRWEVEGDGGEADKVGEVKQGNRGNKRKDKNANFRVFQWPADDVGGRGGGEPTHIVYVGRNRRGNEDLSFKVGIEGDVWMHARGTPGAHVIVRAKEGKYKRGPGIEGWEEVLEIAAGLAAFYSDLRTERKAEITMAECKHILKPRNAPLGAVKLREELGTIVGDPWGVPEVCKEKRAEGGAGEWEIGGRRKRG